MADAPRAIRASHVACDARISKLRARVQELEEQVLAVHTGAAEHRAEMDQLNGRLYHLLCGVAVALKGPHPPHGLHDLSDLPKFARRAMAELRTLLQAEADEETRHVHPH